MSRMRGMRAFGAGIVVGLGAIAGCASNSYFREASVGQVGCEEADMDITETSEFGTRSWTVKCPDKKVWQCEGLKGAARCQPME